MIVKRLRNNYLFIKLLCIHTFIQVTLLTIDIIYMNEYHKSFNNFMKNKAKGTIGYRDRQPAPFKSKVSIKIQHVKTSIDVHIIHMHTCVCILHTNYNNKYQ